MIFSANIKMVLQAKRITVFIGLHYVSCLQHKVALKRAVGVYA